MKTLYVSDLDGTLLNSNTSLSEKTIRIINELVEQGLEFTFATARSINSASLVSKGLHLRTPLIVYNGVHMLDPNDYSVLYAHAFQKEDAAHILQMFLDQGLYPFVYAYIDGAERVSYVDHEFHEGALHYMNSRPGDRRFRRVKTIEQLLEGEVFYFTGIHDKVHLDRVYAPLEEEDAYVLLYHQELYREEYWLEILPSDVSKAKAVLRLKEMKEYDRVVSFGDAINDLPMFQISDECYAVANAIDELKKDASAVIGSNDEDAVALWLQENASITE